MAELDSFLGQISEAYSQRLSDATRLSSALAIDEASHLRLSSALSSLGQSVDLGARAAAALRIDSSERVVTLLASLLGHVAKHPPIQALLDPARPPPDFDALKAAYESWSLVYARASTVFSQQDGAWFGPSLRHFGTTLVALAQKVDSSPQAPPGRMQLMDAASRVSKSAGVAAVDRTAAPGQDTKRANVLWLANLSFKVYFKLRNLRLCDTVLSSVESAFTLNRQNAGPAASATGQDAAEACYSRADRVAYRYYLGRLRLSQHRIRQAFGHLRWAFENCTNRQMGNKRLILVPLLVSSLILGIYPSASLLRAAELEGPFGGLTQRLRLGDGAGTMRELERWREWHRAKGQYLLLREKLQVGVWRNLFRRTYLCALVLGKGSSSSTAASDGGGAPTKAPPPTLALDGLVTAARLSWQDESITADDVECVAASLIDQGYLKGYASHAARKLVFARANSFPAPSSVY